MKYQLVLQFPEDVFTSFDEMVALEDSLIAQIGELGLVDGHDAGSGEVNIFIHTNDPGKVFEKLSATPPLSKLKNHLKAAFRDLSQDEFTVIHPVGETEFAVM